MKNLLALLLFFGLSFAAKAQVDTLDQDYRLYRIIKTDGGELVGRVISQDAREVYFHTQDNRKIYIPQHSIKEIVPLNARDFGSDGEYIGEDRFATRYFISTNGLPIKKGEHYVQWNLYGPDFQFSLGNDIGLGVMTSWVGVPLIANVKKSWQLDKNLSLAVGGLVGTLSWANIRSGGALPFGALTIGDRRSNFTLSLGHGIIWSGNEVVTSNGGSLASFAGMTKLSTKLSLVFDSFIVLGAQPDARIALIIPGLRWHQEEGKAFQIGLLGIVTSEGAAPIPIPMVQWYRSL